jgi:hypothetical protein
MGLMELLLLTVVPIAMAFWIWMIVDCATNEPSIGNDKLVWIIIIVFGHVIGALVYYFVRHCQRFEEA